MTTSLFKVWALRAVCTAPVCLSLIAPQAAYAKKLGSAKITIDSTPAGANIYIDGKDAGIQGQSGPKAVLKLTKEKHTLLLELDGYKPMEQTINVKAAQRLAFKLVAMPARLEMKPLATNQNAQGAEVFVDGALAGTLPGTVEVGTGRHTVEVRRPGYLPYTEQVEVKTGETRQMFIGLISENKPGTGSVIVNAPSGAEVSIDGQPKGPAPVTVDSLAAGDHVVDVQPATPEFLPFRKNVRITAGQQSKLEVAFAAKPVAPLTMPVTVVPRKPRNAYVVTLGRLQSCTTPCSLQALPGPQGITVAGPGSKIFTKEITIPNVASQVVVQHFTLSRVIAGPILTVLGIGFAGGAAYFFVKEPFQQPSIDYTLGSLLAIHATVFTIVGLVQLGTIKTNRASVIGLGQVSALPPPPRLRLMAAGIVPTQDRTGAVGGLTFAY